MLLQQQQQQQRQAGPGAWPAGRPAAGVRDPKLAAARRGSRRAAARGHALRLLLQALVAGSAIAIAASAGLGGLLNLHAGTAPAWDVVVGMQDRTPGGLF